MKRVLQNTIPNTRNGFIKALGRDTIDYPVAKKATILAYLKGAQVVMVGADYGKDPISGKVYSGENCIYSDGEYMWNTRAIYMIEKYNFRLDDAFLAKFNVER